MLENSYWQTGYRSSEHKVAIFIDGDFWHGGQWLRRNLKALEEQFSQSPSVPIGLQKFARRCKRIASTH